MFVVFRTLLIIWNILYGLFAAVYYSCLIVQRKFTEIFYGENLKTEIEMLVRTASRTKNLPRHIVFVFGSREDTILDCVRIIGWCITLGVPYVSFFDTSGFLAKNEGSLKKQIAKQRPELLDHVSWGKSSATANGAIKNGVNGLTGSRSKTRISLLSYYSGKGEIVALTRELAKAVSMGTINSEEVTYELLREKLKLQDIPDPELALIYAKTCSTYGLLPWHTRTTEFLMTPLHVSLSVKDFTHLLEKYSKVEQRYGK